MTGGVPRPRHPARGTSARREGMGDTVYGQDAGPTPGSLVCWPQSLSPVLGPEGLELEGQHGIHTGQEQPGGGGERDWWQVEWAQVAADEEGSWGRVRGGREDGRSPRRRGQPRRL